MAPTFLQKFTKAANNSQQQARERLSSEPVSQKSLVGSLTSISRNRSPSASIKSTSGSNAFVPTHTNTLTSKRLGSESSDTKIPDISVISSGEDNVDDGQTVGHQRSFESAGTSSTQPNVTIIPPSPLLSNTSLESDNEDQQEVNIPPVVVGGTTRKGRTAEQAAKSITLPPPPPYFDDSTPTPTTRRTQDSISSPTSATTVTPTNTNNIVDVTDKNNDNKMASSNNGFAPGLFLRKQASNKSLKSSGKKTPPTDLHIPPLPNHHARAATAPPETSFPTPQDSPVLADAMSESPKEIPKELPPVSRSDSQTTAESTSAPSVPDMSASSKSLGVLQPEQATTSMLSLSSIAPDGSKGSKRPWKRSTTRKPTGLASAIAASGLAIANPTLSASHSAQAAAQISPPMSASTSGQRSAKSTGGLLLNGSGLGSPPYLSTSPAQSTMSTRSFKDRHKTLNTDLSPRSSGKGAVPGKGRPRRSSRAASAKSDAGGSEYSSMAGASLLQNGAPAPSVNGDELFRPDYYSALELDADTSSEDISGSDISGDEYGEGNGLNDIPVTGFAVASTKRNQDFHELFPTVPEGDYLIEDYGCALQREILIQGRLHISENHICFHANIFGWITDLSIPVYEITSLEKKMTAYVIPNAIQITTRQAKYTFTSFLSRDTTFDVMYNIWRLGRPGDSLSIMTGSARGSIDGPVACIENADAPGARLPGLGKVPVAKKATICACGKEGKHYPEIAMEIIIPGTPEKINNLLFASGFIKDFMSENQKLLDIQISDWAPVSPGSKLLTQNMTYIKPLAGSLGPKQTKCELKHEVVYSDFEEFISTVTTTRTPDVPSGGVFAVKTRTCVMWASPVSSKVVVTSQVEWSGRSFIKGIIEKSVIDGQKLHHTDLEKAMRTYIQEHQSEFLPEGVEAAAIPDTVEPESTVMAGDEKEHHPTLEELKQRERERNARGLQWAWDTIDGAYQVAKRSTKGALELVKDAWDQSTSTTILWFLIVLLVLSNLWTLIRMGSNKAEAARKLEARKIEEREKWVQSIVTALWEEMTVGNGGVPVLLQPSHVMTTSASVATPSSPLETVLESVASLSQEQPPLPTRSIENLKEEVKQLRETLQSLEEKVTVMKKGLAEYETELNALD